MHMHMCVRTRAHTHTHTKFTSSWELWVWSTIPQCCASMVVSWVHWPLCHVVCVYMCIDWTDYPLSNFKSELGKVFCWPHMPVFWPCRPWQQIQVCLVDCNNVVMCVCVFVVCDWVSESEFVCICDSICNNPEQSRRQIFKSQFLCTVCLLSYHKGANTHPLVESLLFVIYLL